MARPFLPFFLLLPLLALAAPALPAPAPPPECADTVSGAGRVALPNIAAALVPGGRLDILAVGSATLMGPRAGSAEASFPYRMADALRAAVPGATVELTATSQEGLTAAAMLARMRQAMAGQHYRMVIWQTGTVEAARHLPPAEFARTLAAGAALARQHGADLVLIDPQFSRFLRNHSDLPRYEAAFHAVAGQNGVALFRRFDLMRSWAAAGQIDLERTPSRDHDDVANRLHACLGSNLATLVLNGIAAARS